MITRLVKITFKMVLSCRQSFTGLVWNLSIKETRQCLGTKSYYSCSLSSSMDKRVLKKTKVPFSAQKVFKRFKQIISLTALSCVIVLKMKIIYLIFLRWGFSNRTLSIDDGFVTSSLAKLMRSRFDKRKNWPPFKKKKKKKTSNPGKTFP